MKASFYTLGCKLNYAETAGMERQFRDRGFDVVPFSEPADVCVVNTCSVTDRADREARQIVRRALRTSPGAFIAVVGCYAQLAPETISSIDGVDLVLGASEKFRLFDYAGAFRKFDVPRIHAGRIDEATDFGPAYSAGADDRTRAYLKVQDGCDYNCAFCTIPLARGESRSQSIAATVEQARRIAAMGYREVVLTGVNVGDYGKKDGTSLKSLLQELEGVEGIERIRVSSIEPNLLTDDLLSYWLSSRKVCRHFHLPLQNGTDGMLRSMRRRYSAGQYRDLIWSIRRADPDAGIGADVIVGFPGETEEVFERNFEFIHALPVSYLHVFTYSERPNTPSIDFPGRIEPRVRFSHSDRLRVLGQMKRSEFCRTQTGAVRPVLIEGTIENNRLSGYTDNYVRVEVPYHPSLENAVAEVRIGAFNGDACDAEIVAVRTGGAPILADIPVVNGRNE